MGSSESSTAHSSKETIPQKLPLSPPVVRYNNYPVGYEQIPYPPPYPLYPYGVYPADQYYPPPPPYMQQPLRGQGSPRHHHHHHHDHGTRGHSHHHHHRHRSTSPTEPGRWNRTYREEFATASYPVPPAPTKPPVSSVVTIKVPSPEVKKQTAQRSTSITVKNSSPARNVTFATPRRQSPPPAILNNQNPTITIKPNDFEKAPRVATNHLSKPDDTISVHKFGPDLLTVVQGNTFTSSRPSNRWYDHDYDKRVRPLAVNNLN